MAHEHEIPYESDADLIDYFDRLRDLVDDFDDATGVAFDPVTACRIGKNIAALVNLICTFIDPNANGNREGNPGHSYSCEE